jgi:hypothetical protein
MSFFLSRDVCVASDTRIRRDVRAALGSIALLLGVVYTDGAAPEFGAIEVVHGEDGARGAL